MEDEATHLQRTIERCQRLLESVNDGRVCRELVRMIEEAEQRLREIERRRGE
jgi:transcription initiation factor IIE alpha subunit